MKKPVIICGITAIAAATFFSCSVHSQVKGSAPLYSYSVRDLQNLQDYLLGKPTDADLSDSPYDFNNNGRWDVFDLCTMREQMPVTPQTGSETLVVCFSQTGNTGKIADYIISLTDADSYFIQAAVPYTDEDIRYQDNSCRANQEQNDKSCRPEIANLPENIDAYDVIYLGYPIWWGEEPRIIDTFLESYDFSAKTVIPFCTSGSSGISTSERNIGEIADIGNLLPGKRFAASSSESTVQEWLDSIELPEKSEVQKLSIQVGDTTLSATLADTQAAKELAEKLAESPVTVTLNEYGGFEKVGALPWALTRSDQQTDTVPGDIMLYQGSQMTIFYGSNSWSYTSLGTIENTTQEELSELFGSGDITVTLALK